MDNSKVETLKKNLIEVRKAHRLVYSYQERMLSLVKFIRAHLNGNNLAGVKHFSNPISKVQGREELKIVNEMWAWDFLYSYVFEYYIGGDTLPDGSSYNLSIVQYTDTGFFDSDIEDRCDLSNFEDPALASSKLLFIMEHIPKGKKAYWDGWGDLRQFIEDKKYASAKHKSSEIHPNGPNNSRLLLYSIPLERFVDERTSIDALKEYQAFLKKKGIERTLV